MASQSRKDVSQEQDTYTPGMIVNIVLKNFVTYGEVHLMLKPKINILLGPNGTGKSTFLCAVVLGLGGKPSIIGRSPIVADYIKHGCEQAIIELELYDKPKNYLVKRKIFLDSTTQWYLNGKQVSFKQIEELTDKFNIKINNLCQILPQDRVHDFAKMDKKQLLEATLKSVGDSNLFDWFEKLKSFRTKLVNAKQSLDDVRKIHSVELHNLKKLESEVETFNKKKSALQSLEVIKKKLAWLKYQEKDIEKDQVVKEVEALKVEVEKTLSECKPIKNALNEAQKEEFNYTQQLDNLEKNVSNGEKYIGEAMRKIFQIQESILSAETEFASKVEAEKSRNQEMINLTKQIEEIKKSFTNSSENSLIELVSKCDKEIKHCTDLLSSVRYSEREISNKLNNITQAINALEYQLKKYSSVTEKKLELLSQSADLQKAYDWVSNNQDKFKSTVCGPMFLDLNILDSTKAQFVEKTIPRRDLIAFVCTSAEDTTKLLKILRDQMKLKVNVVTSEAPPVPVKQLYRPKFPIDKLKIYGFTNYLLEVVDGPEPILNYLCKSYGFHNIPLGNSDVENCIDHLPKDIGFFFSQDMCFRRNSSRFSNELLTMIEEVGSAIYLAHSLNVDLLNATKSELERKKQELSSLEQVKAIELQKKKEIELNMNKAMNEKRSARKQIEYIKSTSVRLKMKEEELKSLETSKFDENSERNNLMLTIYKYINESQAQEKKIKKISNHSLLPTIKKMKIIKLQLCNVTKKCTQLERDFEAANRQCAEIEEKLERKKVHYENVRAEAKSLLKAAKRACDNLSPDHKEFEDKYVPQFLKLPDTIEELQEELHDKESDLAFLEGTHDDAILKQFEHQQTVVNRLETQLNEQESYISSHNEKVDELKNKWLNKLTELLEIIDSRFRLCFSFLKCSGQVELDQGPDPEAYENYGLNIKVKFRNETNLESLDPFRQSGGERSLSTAVYLLSLQSIIKVPFRMVDEINQGMDKFNEIRVYFLIMCSLAKEKSSQYVLITPKLLDGTKFSKDVTVHTIFSGSLANSLELNDLSVGDDSSGSADDDDDDDDYMNFDSSSWSTDLYCKQLGIV